MKNTKLIQNKLDVLVNDLPNGKYKMGELKVLTLKSGNLTMCSEIDNRQYYSGRGAKYNKNIKHDFIEETISMAELNRRWSKVVKQRKAIKKFKTEQANKVKSSTPFDVEINVGEIKLYNFLRIDFKEIVNYLKKHINSITESHIEHNYNAWKNDYKSQIMIDETNALYTPCGCNPFRLELWQTNEPKSYIC